jgi:predicted Zn-dependent protease
MYAFGNSKGVFRHYAFDSVGFNTVITHSDGATGFGAATSHLLEGLDITEAFKKAYEKAQMAINPQFAEVGAYTVILEPSAVAGLMGFVLGSLNGMGVLRGTSYATGKLNEKCFGDNITVIDDIFHPSAFPRYFDAEGFPKKPLTLIENGVIKNFMYDAKTAQKAGAKPTGHSFRGYGSAAGNVVMQGGESSLEEMIKNTKKGLLISRFHYTNYVNPKKLQVTGLTRDGTFMIEDGKIVNSIANMRFTEEMTAAFSNVVEMSKELTKTGFGLFPAAKIENFHFTSRQK